jgi:hypothetical protein
MTTEDCLFKVVLPGINEWEDGGIESLRNSLVTSQS